MTTTSTLLQPVLPTELCLEIATFDWRVYGKLRICCKSLHTELTRLDPYKLFTWQRIDYGDITHTVHWITRDNKHIRCIEIMLCGWTKVSFGKRKYIEFNYGSIPYIDENDVIQPGEFTYDITTFDSRGKPMQTMHVYADEWQARVQPWYALADSVRSAE